MFLSTFEKQLDAKRRLLVPQEFRAAAAGSFDGVFCFPSIEHDCLEGGGQALFDTWRGVIDELAFGVTLKGAVPTGKLAQAVAEWRDAGGTVELDNLRLNWGGVGATASGTIALDHELQPIGGFSGAIEGYDQILTGLVQSGRIRAADAGLARLALAMLAKAGPDGRPEIKTAFRIQNGQMFLGPAKLGKAPRLAWE